MDPKTLRLGQGKGLTGQSKELILRIKNHFKREKELKSAIPSFNNVSGRLECATGLSKITLKRIFAEFNSENMVSSPKKRGIELLQKCPLLTISF